MNCFSRVLLSIFWSVFKVSMFLAGIYKLFYPCYYLHNRVFKISMLIFTFSDEVNATIGNLMEAISVSLRFHMLSRTIVTEPLLYI